MECAMRRSAAPLRPMVVLEWCCKQKMGETTSSSADIPGRAVGRERMRAASSAYRALPPMKSQAVIVKHRRRPRGDQPSGHMSSNDCSRCCIFSLSHRRRVCNRPRFFKPLHVVEHPFNDPDQNCISRNSAHLQTSLSSGELNSRKLASPKLPSVEEQACPLSFDSETFPTFVSPPWRVRHVCEFRGEFCSCVIFEENPLSHPRWATFLLSDFRDHLQACAWR